MDAGWYGPEMKMSSDATTVSPDKDLDIPALCQYAESKGIGLMVLSLIHILLLSLLQMMATSNHKKYLTTSHYTPFPSIMRNERMEKVI